MCDEDLIKVRYVEDGSSESMWAEKLDGNRAKIRNIPFFVNSINFDDIVEIDYVNEDDYWYWKIIKVIEQKTCKVFITYEADGDYEVGKKKYSNIYDAISQCNGIVEGATLGFAFAAFDSGADKLQIAYMMQMIADVKEWGFCEKSSYEE